MAEIITYECDIGGCPSAYRYAVKADADRQRGQSWEAAKKAGWLYDGEMDVCPACTEIHRKEDLDAGTDAR